MSDLRTIRTGKKFKMFCSGPFVRRITELVPSVNGVPAVNETKFFYLGELHHYEVDMDAAITSDRNFHSGKSFYIVCKDCIEKNKALFEDENK